MSLNLYQYYNQTKYWLPNGKPAVLIESMDERWKENAAAWLLRHAQVLVTKYQVDLVHSLAEGLLVTEDGRMVRAIDVTAHPEIERPAILLPQGEWAEEAFEKELEWAYESPQDWMRSMPLYKVLASAGEARKRFEDYAWEQYPDGKQAEAFAEWMLNRISPGHEFTTQELRQYYHNWRNTR